MSDHDVPADLRDDDTLVAELDRALDALEPVPGDAVAAAVAAFDLGRIDDELAELLFDSLLDDPAVAMRHTGVQEARSLGFLAQGHRIDIELLDEDGVLLGQIEPVDAVRVEAETGRGTDAADVDDLGRFRLAVERGSFRLRITTSEGGVVVTPWITW